MWLGVVILAALGVAACVSRDEEEGGEGEGEDRSDCGRCHNSPQQVRSAANEDRVEVRLPTEDRRILEIHSTHFNTPITFSPNRRGCYPCHTEPETGVHPDLGFDEAACLQCHQTGAPDLDNSDVSCDSCHTNNNHDLPDLNWCSGCHTETVDPRGRIARPDLHMDGATLFGDLGGVDCGTCHTTLAGVDPEDRGAGPNDRPHPAHQALELGCSRCHETGEGNERETSWFEGLMEYLLEEPENLTDHLSSPSFLRPLEDGSRCAECHDLYGSGGRVRDDIGSGRMPNPSSIWQLSGVRELEGEREGRSIQCGDCHSGHEMADLPRDASIEGCRDCHNDESPIDVPLNRSVHQPWLTTDE